MQPIPPPSRICSLHMLDSLIHTSPGTRPSTCHFLLWTTLAYSLTSSRSLFKHFLIRQTLPITQYKRARNSDNQAYRYFPPLTTWHTYLSKNFPSLFNFLPGWILLMTLIYKLLLACPDGEIQGHNTAHVQWNQAE